MYRPYTVAKYKSCNYFLILRIRDILIRCSLPISQCRGQAFDGASNMSGIRNGVQALVKKSSQ